MANFTNTVQGTVSEYSWERTTQVASTGALTTTSGRVVSGTLSNVRFATRAGSKTPGYRAIVKAGGTLPDLVLTYEKYVAPNDNQAILEYFSGNGQGWTRETRRMQRCNLYVPGVPAKPFTDSELGLRLIKKAKGNEWSLPVFLGELKETAGMVTKSAVHLTQMVLALRKGNISGFFRMFHPSAKQPRERAARRAKAKFDQNFGRDPAKAVSGAWLEYQYGWKPFLKDVDDAFKLLSDMQDRSDFNISSVRTRLKREVIDSINSPTNLTSFAGISLGGSILTSWELSGSATWRFSIRELNTLGKLGLINPLSVAYNLATLSFVADWFIPIGSYIDALDVPMRFSHVGGTYGYKATGTVVYSGLRPSQAGWTLTSHNLQTSNRVYVQRRPMTGLPTPKLADLSFKADLGLQRAVSATALLSQTVRNVFKMKPPAQPARGRSFRVSVSEPGVLY